MESFGHSFSVARKKEDGLVCRRARVWIPALISAARSAGGNAMVRQPVTRSEIPQDTKAVIWNGHGRGYQARRKRGGRPGGESSREGVQVEKHERTGRQG